jgi:heme-degrading monooxygenase HmoA
MSQHSITIFRSRLRPGIREEYAAVAGRMEALAQTMPGFISIDTYEAADGNRVSIVEFASHEAAQAWRKHPEHREAQTLGRAKFYSEYRIQVATLAREYEFAPSDAAAARSESQSE